LKEAVMEGFWYYAIENKPVGPLTFTQLTVALSGLSEPRHALLWHPSFDAWREARDVPEVLVILPDLAHPPPLQATLPLQADYGTKPDPKKSEPPKTGWRKAAGTALSVVIFAISFGAVREFTRSATSPKPDFASPISGSTKEAFTKSGMEACLKKQESDPDTKALRLSRETLVSYCSCFVDALANSTTFGDLNSNPKAGTISPDMQAKINKASPPCWEDIQRKLMGASER
jgi:GYF domain 2